MLIAVGDQRCQRVHMVRVLYHWNLIRLRERGKERKGKQNGINIRGKGSLRLLPHNYNLVCRLLETGAAEF